MENNKIKKVIILGSGGLKIGQAGEFDYSGSQAIKALKEDNIKIVLVNPNIANVQTSKGMADKIYFLPVDVSFVEKIIQKEKPDGILFSFGGQTALNCGINLYKKGILKKFKVKVLGTNIKTIIDTEDRELFNRHLKKINVDYPKSIAVNNLKEALIARKKLKFPLMVRSAYALGGKGSGISRNKKEFKQKCQEAFSSSPQLLIEEWLGGWKEIEYEVVRDSFDNCLTICNMENIDPLGIHTGESIVVAPSQTLSNTEYYKLRKISLKVIRHLNIIGECNIQYALNPISEEYRVIEVNARLSRSSALASKATGYPLAFVATKLTLGYNLTEIKNKITKKTFASFEPALDYCVIKIPRWDLKKFKEVDEQIGTEMKSVGEVMAIGRKFEEALQKALRMVAIGTYGLTQNNFSFFDLKKEMSNPTDKRIFAIAEALSKGETIENIYNLTKIDRWFLYKINNIIACDKELSKLKLNKNLLLKAKKLGFSDDQISQKIKIHKTKIRKIRKKWKIIPVVKQIDSLAAEYPAKTNYLYFTYNGTTNDIQPAKNSIIVLGSGAYRIGSSVEFDWCCVNAIITVRRKNFLSIMINCNPETVSTDYDVCDRLYFEEITTERVLDIYEFEHPRGVIISMGGQIPNNLCLPLYKAGVKILGTSSANINNAENRFNFSKMLDKLGIDQPEWKELTNIKKAKQFANNIKYPVLIRPSYVLSGAAMNVVWDDDSLVKYLNAASEINPRNPVVITKFIENCKEIEIDAVAHNGKLLIYAIGEHIENAGVHSGDATIVLPAQKLYIETIRRVKKIVKLIAKELNITGPFNIQFLAYQNEIKVIECNLRASRSFPFCSKIYKQNMIDMATRVILGEKVKPAEKSSIDLDYVGVKAAQFSFSRLKGADPSLGVEMSSTGEVGCLGRHLNEAFLKAFLSVGFKIPQKNILISMGPIENRGRFLSSVIKLKKMGYHFFASPGTAKYFCNNGIRTTTLYWPDMKKNPNIAQYLMNKKIDLVINIPKSNSREELNNDYLIRRMAIDYEISLISNLQVAIQMVEAIQFYQKNNLEILSWDEY